MAKIAILDDEPAIVELLSVLIENAGHEVIAFVDGIEGYHYLKQHTVDALILDIMMPEIDGLEILKNIREIFDYPIILLTAKSQQKDVLKGLYSGADDYIKKPFDNLELMARLNVHLKRSGHQEKNVLHYRNVTLDIAKHTFSINNFSIALTPIEFQIMEMLMKNVNQVVSSEVLFKTIWKEQYFEKDTNTVSAHIKNIRCKIYDKDKKANLIKTVWGVGYKIE